MEPSTEPSIEPSSEPAAKKPPEESSMTWASINSEDSSNVESESTETSDDDLTPPIAQQPTVHTPTPYTQQAQVSDTADEFSKTDPDMSVSDTDDLNLDLEKVQKADEQQAFQSAHPYEDQFSSSLSVDQQQMSQIQQESYGGKVGDTDSGYDTPIVKSTYIPQKKSFGSKIGSFFGKIIVVVSILVIIASIGLIAAVNLEILSKEKTKQLRSFLVSVLPINIKNPLEGIEITKSQGQ
ncbi:MAG: hypothetical protein GTN99_02700, partial [Candidatus Dadabacteria bacterium]|nr:hypothetical protein [Candidatus Dadabacteria bacterium]